VRLSFEGQAPAGESARELRVADAERELSFTLGGGTVVSFLVEVPAGESRLTLKTDPAATSIEDAVQLSAPRAARALGVPQLVAELVTEDPGF
jgi:hypothetical protein